MEPSPEPKETIARFEKLLAALATNRVDFAVVGGLEMCRFFSPTLPDCA
jgi:hypothetical protein